MRRWFMYAQGVDAYNEWQKDRARVWPHVSALKKEQRALRKKRRITYAKGAVTCKHRGHKWKRVEELRAGEWLNRCVRCENAQSVTNEPPQHFNCRSVFVPVVGDGKIEVENA